MHRPFGTCSVHILMCPSFTLSCLQELMFVVWFFCQLTRWVHNAKYWVRPVWSVLPQRREWFDMPHVGFLSNFQLFLLWLSAICWCKLISNSLKKSGLKVFSVCNIAFFTAAAELKMPTQCLTKSEIASKASPGSKVESNYFWICIPKLIYLPHLASINGTKVQVTGLFNTSTRV